MLSRLVLCVALLASPVAMARPNFDSSLRERQADRRCGLSDQPTFVLFVCDRGLTFWYYTKPSHPAYPGVIERSLTQGPAGWTVRESGTSFASEERQAEFQTWMGQIAALDIAMKAAITREHR